MAGEGKETLLRHGTDAEKKPGTLYRLFRRFVRTSGDVDSEISPPTSYDRCTREIRPLQAVHTFSDGAKFEIQSVISPRFSTAHSFSWGSQQQQPMYMFSALYSGKKFFLNGVIDDQGSLQFQGNYNWFQKNEDPSPKDEKGPAAAAAPHLSPVMQAQSYVGTATLLRAQLHKIRAKSVVQIEQEYYGKDFVLTLKASSHNVFQTLLPARKLRDLFTPNGSYSAAYMHRITKNLSIGAEYTHQYFGERLQDSMMSYAVRYAAYPKEQYPQPPAFPPSIPSPFPPVSLKEPERSFVAIFSPSVGILYSSFYQRLSQRLEAFADINIPTMKPPENAPPHSTAGTLSLGFKLDTLNSTMRTMVDSSLTVVTTIEERLFPGFSVQISARTNHGSDNTGVGHVGLSFALES